MDKEITVTLRGATRKNNSVNGNPTWLLHTTEGDFLTQSDASIGYDVSNRTESTGRSGSWTDKRVTLTVTVPARRVKYWRLAE